VGTQWRDETVRSGGVRLAVRDYGGDGPPIVLLHGHLGNTGSFDVLGPLLAAHFRVVGYDQRGHGWSESGPTSVSDYVEDIDAVVAAFDLDRPTIYGSSFGSLIGLGYIGAGRDVRAFVNEDGWVSDPIAPPPNAPQDGSRLVDADTFEQVGAGFALAGPTGSATHARGFVRLADGTFELRPSFTDMNAKVRVFSELNVSAIYEACTAPVLLLQADGSDREGPMNNDAAANLRTAGPVEIAPFPTGHWISAADPEGVAQSVIDFVTKH
jgi:pimeloyl-ACP methyl ester carboxylesterase